MEVKSGTNDVAGAGAHLREDEGGLHHNRARSAHRSMSARQRQQGTHRQTNSKEREIGDVPDIHKCMAFLQLISRVGRKKKTSMRERERRTPPFAIIAALLCTMTLIE
jgi:hypothetical protein